MMDEAAEAVRQRLRRLGAGYLPVAVRLRYRRGPAGDVLRRSAGHLPQHPRRGAVLDAVSAAGRRCGPPARSATAAGRHPAEDVALAVVVQELVPADAAGVLFTADPMTGARDQMIVNAAWGLGEAIVGGQVTPDTILVDQATGSVTERRLSDKPVMTVRTANGTREVPVPAEPSVGPSSPTAAVELARLGVRVEALYERPMDIEWALHEGEIFLVQARPITVTA